MSLRLFGAVHRFALRGDAPELAEFYPSCGGSPNHGTNEELWIAFESACRTNIPEIIDRLAQAPQTNEVGRSAALRGALDLVAAPSPLPIRLLEIGTSAGLNLLVDQFRLTFDGGTRGPIESAVELEDAWTGNTPASTPVVVTQRRGCDVHPLDAAHPDDALGLQSFVWPDQTDRLARLRGALAMAIETPVEVIQSSAEDFLADASPSNGFLTVIMHSVMWQYMPPDVRATASRHLRRLTNTATESAPVAHISLEPPRAEDDSDVDFRAARRHGGFVITAGCAPFFTDRVVGYCPPHGPPAHWL